MKRWVWYGHAVEHSVATVVLLCVFVILSALLASSFGGFWLAGIVTVFVCVALFGRTDVDKTPTLQAMRAKHLYAGKFPRLTGLDTQMARRAGLRNTPQLYWLASSQPNAFVSGDGRTAKVVLTNEVARRFASDEVEAVIAHEVCHLKNNDMHPLHVLDIVVTWAKFSRVAMAILGGPLIGMNLWSISYGEFLLVMALPTVLEWLQVRINRVREYKADLHAARLTRNPEALARALGRIDTNDWQLDHAWATHPPTLSRIARMRELGGAETPARPG